MGFATSWINGVSLGFELFDKESMQFMAEDAKWGIGLDLLILRVLLVFY